MQAKYYGLIAGGLALGIIAGMTIATPFAGQQRPTIYLPDNWTVAEAPEDVNIQPQTAAPETGLQIQDIIRQVEQEYGGHVIEIELDRRAAGEVYQIKLVDAQRTEQRLVVDAETGEILGRSAMPGGETGRAVSHREHIPMQDIITRFEQEYNGRVVEVEFEQENTHDEYEIELIDSDGIKWKIDVDAHTGEVLTRKQDGRVAGDMFRVFEGHIPMQDIITRVETEYGGRVVDIELERESFHDEYEIKLIDDRGVKWKIEIDAHSGELLKRKRD